MNFKKITSVGLALVVLVVPGFGALPAAQAQQAYSAPMKGWWRLNDGVGTMVEDSSGQGNDGTLQGGAYYASDVSMGTVMSFTDGPAEIRVPHNSTLEPAIGTFMVWVKVDARQNADIFTKYTHLMVRTNQPGVFSVYGLRIKRNGAVQGFVANDDPKALSCWTWVQSAKSLLKAGRWHHLALRWDGSVLALFVDGRLRAAAPYDPVPDLGLSYNGESEFLLGRATYWGSRYDGQELEFLGEMSDARLYAGAVSETEISNTYAAYASLARQ